MTWRVTKVEEERQEFIRQVHIGTRTFTDLCQEFQVSRKTGYKWVHRYEEYGEEGLNDRSRRPHSQPGKTNEELIRKQKRVLEDWLNGEVLRRFENRIVPIDFKVASKWGDLSGACLKKGTPQPVVDCLIASTAIGHDLILVTENIRNFAQISELKIFNAWE